LYVGICFLKEELYNIYFLLYEKAFQNIHIGHMRRLL